MYYSPTTRFLHLLLAYYSVFNRNFDYYISFILANTNTFKNGQITTLFGRMNHKVTI